MSVVGAKLWSNRSGWGKAEKRFSVVADRDSYPDRQDSRGKRDRASRAYGTAQPDVSYPQLFELLGETDRGPRLQTTLQVLQVTGT